MNTISSVLEQLLIDYNVTGDWVINEENKIIDLYICHNYISPSLNCDIINNELFDKYTVNILLTYDK